MIDINKTEVIALSIANLLVKKGIFTNEEFDEEQKLIEQVMTKIKKSLIKNETGIESDEEMENLTEIFDSLFVKKKE